MSQRLKDLVKAREELRAKVKALPVAERVQAAGLFELFERMVGVEETGDRASDALYKAYDEQLFAITERSDAIVEGRQAATAEDFEFWKQHVDSAYVLPAQPDQPAPVPSFWRRFIQNAGLYSGEFDEPLLDAIVNISVFREEAQEGEQKVVVLRVVFRFRPNEFFANEQLSLRLFKEEDDTLLRSEGCRVEWTRNPTMQREVSKKRNKKTGEVRSFTKEVQKPTLFEIFEDFAQGDEGEEEDEAEQRMTLLGLADFVDELQDCLPYALEYYLDLHPDDEDEDDEDENDEEDDGEAAAPAPVAAAPAAPDAAGGEQPVGGNNCKQQ